MDSSITTEVLARLIRDTNPYGTLHIVVDDGNMEDSSIDFCLGLPNLTDEERKLALLLKSCPLEQRDAAWKLSTEITPESEG